ncbi:MAG: DEAD/DEAH box helicase, partial [Candidatus Eremiobacteraeota bacterium]|nr:DEAD/DEAH box helicase [Candidatus Eremiobacteraeota bacterium]
MDETVYSQLASVNPHALKAALPRTWGAFFGRHGNFTPSQLAAIPPLLAGENVLLCAPTASGKTEAALAPLVERHLQQHQEQARTSGVTILYLLPTRALINDLWTRLSVPLQSLRISSAVRTYDLNTFDPKRPARLLLTTPESLALMVAMDSYRKTLTHVETVIVDEVHALAGSKRGAHLALLLESLADLTRVPLRRVGLSATVAPLDRVAAYLAGTERECAVVDCRDLREMKLDVVAPFAGAMAPLAQCARTAYALTKDVRSTLVFCNVRSQAERVAHEMEQAGEPADEIAVPEGGPRTETASRDRRIGVHHSALERNVRHRTEAELRSGKLRTVVCSSSLELGVDIGYVDRVILLGGARGMTPTLQRVGRAGHRPGAVATGVVLAQDRDDIIEAAATRRCIRAGIIEEIDVPDAPLDVVAQWLVGLCAPDNRVTVDGVLALARRAYPYRQLREDDLRACIAYLSGGGVGPEEAHVRRVGTDGDAVYGLGREQSAAYFENVGTIPDESTIGVAGAGGHAIGRLDESFASSMRVGDVFLLEGRALRVEDVGPRGLRVKPHAGRPTVPQWSSHLKGISRALASEIDVLRNGVADALRNGGPQRALAYLRTRYALDGVEAAHVVRYVAQQLALSDVPDATHPLIEIYRMDNRQTAVIHTGAGRRINETLARVVGARLHRRLRINSSLTTDDNGFLVALPQRKHVQDAAWASLLHADEFDDDLLAGLRSGWLLRQQFRYVANT